jgi:hypothetical protein
MGALNVAPFSLGDVPMKIERENLNTALYVSSESIPMDQTELYEDIYGALYAIRRGLTGSNVFIMFDFLAGSLRVIDKEQIELFQLKEVKETLVYSLKENK